MKQLKTFIRKRIDRWVINYVERRLLSEIQEVETGRFIKVYPNYEMYSAAGRGVFNHIMGRNTMTDIILNVCKTAATNQAANLSPIQWAYS